MSSMLAGSEGLWNMHVALLLQSEPFHLFLLQDAPTGTYETPVLPLGGTLCIPHQGHSQWAKPAFKLICVLHADVGGSGTASPRKGRLHDYC